MTTHVVLFGAPAVGKSTVATRLLMEDPHLASFGVRKQFAWEMAHGTSLGEQARPYAQRGQWLPDELVIAAVEDGHRRGVLSRGSIMEGVPATRGQADLLDRLFERLGTLITAVIYLHASVEVSLQRSARRTVCNTCDNGSAQAVPSAQDPSRCRRCGGQITRRPNDTPTAMKARLDEHERHVAAVRRYYEERNRLTMIDASLPPERVYAAVTAALHRSRLAAGVNGATVRSCDV